jgi:serine/threonine protein kinase
VAAGANFALATSFGGPGSAPFLGPSAAVPYYTDVPITSVYELKQALGKGAQAVVYLAEHKRFPGELFAVKKMDKLRSPRHFVEAEVEGMRRVRGHEHVVSLHEVYDSPTHLYLVMELLSGGELFDRLIDKGAYSEEEAREALRSCVLAVHHMHMCGVMHRDLKP